MFVVYAAGGAKENHGSRVLFLFGMVFVEKNMWHVCVCSISFSACARAPRVFVVYAAGAAKTKHHRARFSDTRGTLCCSGYAFLLGTLSPVLSGVRCGREGGKKTTKAVRALFVSSVRFFGSAAFASVLLRTKRAGRRKPRGAFLVLLGICLGCTHTQLPSF